MIRIFFFLILPFVNGDKVVQTNSGPISGISLKTKNVEAFLGIPYAEPPVGNLRFARPVPKSPWKETFTANELPPACVQGMTEMTSKFMNQSDRMDEDCLYLNLWVPKTKSILKTVMVFIHGGAFMTGASNVQIYDGATLSEHGDVIVASMNYRVGTLGFFSGFIDEAAGSMGMYDQVLAIQWIKYNAKHFGGDPDNIVLFGQSVGAFSISMHMVSPLSKNLFKRAILQSGTSINLMCSDDNIVLRIASQMISVHLGCASNNEELNENPKAVVKCMKSISPEKISEVDSILFRKPLILVPRIGDEFLPTNTIDFFRRGEFKDTEVLLGVARDEGTIFTAFQLGFDNDDFLGETIDPKSFNETLAKEFVRILARKGHQGEIIENYFKRVEKESGYTYLKAASDITGDSVITCGSVFQADFQSLKKHSVYFYMFDYRSPSSRYPEWIGVPHFEEVEYVFGNPLQKTFSQYEEELSKDIMDMWTSFAKTGNPNIQGGLKWPEYSYEDPKFLIIGLRDRVGVKPDDYRCEAWRKLYRSTIDEEVIQNLNNSRD